MASKKSYIWTEDGSRLHYQSSSQNDFPFTGFNWLFLPGGPGLGSEALSNLTELLKDKIPGTIWHLDLPNDGSNILKDKPILNSRSAITQAISALDHVILVAHSSLGMLAQTMPELEELLSGLVLIGSAPDASWQTQFAEFCINNFDPIIAEAEKEYAKNPGNETLRNLLLAAAKRCFVTEKSLIAGRQLIERIPVNHSASEQESLIFNSKEYLATWIPQKINTLIINGSEDYITPLKLFDENEQYHRENILIKKISNAGHYPWLENTEEIVSAFQVYSKKFKR
ncbi:MAG: alpha/beta hydrolase [Solimicrobium sp.]|jgi:pimeloyl-ACP methyl ester carboxylesterase|nr:alpha/beta hydrolase [Solimicrobium sp.]